MKYIYIIIACLSIILAQSCDRSGIFEEFEKPTPYEYHVKVVSDDNNTQPVEGVNVYLFAEEKDQQTFTNILVEKQTNKDGEVIFQPSDLTKGKGFYYLAVEKSNYSQLASSRYLLINDGHTIQWVKIVETLLSVTPKQLIANSSDTEPAIGAEIKFYLTEADRDNRVNAIEGMTRTLTSGTSINYKKDDLLPIYRTVTFISVEKVVDGKLLVGKINPTIAFGSKSYETLLQPVE